MSEKKRRIAVLSDTHNLLRDEVREVLHTCEGILHGGDVSRPEILEELKTYGTVYAVRGNNDKDWEEELPRELYVTLYGLRIYLVHKKKDLPADLKPVELVVYGHSHKYEEREEQGIFYLNPGSCGPRRFSQPVTMAVLTVEERREGKPGFAVEKIDLLPRVKPEKLPDLKQKDLQKLIGELLLELERGASIGTMAKRHGISREFAEQICRISVTHPGVSAQGILDKLEVNAIFQREEKDR